MAEDIFTGVIGVLDDYGRPIFVVPVDLPQQEPGKPETQPRIHVTDTSLDFYLRKKLIGRVDKNIDDTILVLASLQKEIGLIAWSAQDEKNGIPVPTNLTHIATVAKGGI
jgi:hypothetical protein